MECQSDIKRNELQAYLGYFASLVSENANKKISISESHKFFAFPRIKILFTLSVSHSVTSDSSRPHGLYIYIQLARLLCPWTSPGKNTGVGSHSLIQGIFLIQGSNLGLPHCRWILYYLSHQLLQLFTQLCPILCDPMDCSTLGFPALQDLPEFAQTHFH